MTEDETKALARQKRNRRLIALGVGMVLALVCKSLPSQYRVACDAILSLCTGGAF